MPKHSKGDWYIQQPISGAPLVRTANRPIAKVLYDGGSEDREVYANARLIVAAPNLLNACREARIVIHAFNAETRDYFPANDRHAAAIREIVRVEAQLDAAITDATQDRGGSQAMNCPNCGSESQ